MRKKNEQPNGCIEYGPDPVIDPPALPAGDPLGFLNTRLIPLLSDGSSEKAFIEKGEGILKDLWRRTHALRHVDDREKRGRGSVKVEALTAIGRGLVNKEHGRSGFPTQGDLERILGARMPYIDEDTRRKYAKLYRLTILSHPESLSKNEWAWLARHDPDHVHRAFFIFLCIRYSVMQRGGKQVTAKERESVECYVKICDGIQKLGKGQPFSAPFYVEKISFPLTPR